jgi:hypothetical protein
MAAVGVMKRKGSAGGAPEFCPARGVGCEWRSIELRRSATQECRASGAPNGCYLTQRLRGGLNSGAPPALCGSRVTI